MDTLLFVYNVNADAFSSLKDTVHKVVAPGTYPCRLCGLTFGLLEMKSTWRTFLDELPVPVTFLHKDEFGKRYADLAGTPLPALFAVQGDALQVLLNAEQIGTATDLEQLMALTREAVAEVS